MSDSDSSLAQLSPKCRPVDQLDHAAGLVALPGFLDRSLVETAGGKKHPLCFRLQAPAQVAYERTTYVPYLAFHLHAHGTFDSVSIGERGTDVDSSIGSGWGDVHMTVSGGDTQERSDDLLDVVGVSLLNLITTQAKCNLSSRSGIGGVLSAT